MEIETRISNYEANTYTKTEIDSLFHNQPLYEIEVKSQSDIDVALNIWDRFPNKTCTKEVLMVIVPGLSLEGGAWIIETFRTNNAGWQTATRYNHIDRSLPLLRRERNYIEGWGLDGKWNLWVNVYS